MNEPTQIGAMIQQDSVVLQDGTIQDDAVFLSAQETLGCGGSISTADPWQRLQAIAHLLAIGATRAVRKGGCDNSLVC